MSTNCTKTTEGTEMADCDGEKVVTMMDVLQEQEEFEEDANAVLGASDDKNCTYTQGYIKRQAIYACLTCCTEAKIDPTKRAGMCLACSLNCHENHELIELYTRRNFRCDCGNPKFNSHPCRFTPNKTDLNEENEYNQNFIGLYCICHRPYPDPEATTEDEMIQCTICEDWLHATHLEAILPDNDQYSEMICKACMEKNEFLHDYSHLAVNIDANIDVVTLNETAILNEEHENLCDSSKELSSTKLAKINGEIIDIMEEHDKKKTLEHNISSSTTDIETKSNILLNDTDMIDTNMKSNCDFQDDEMSELVLNTKEISDSEENVNDLENASNADSIEALDTNNIHNSKKADLSKEIELAQKTEQPLPHNYQANETKQNVIDVNETDLTATDKHGAENTENDDKNIKTDLLISNSEVKSVANNENETNCEISNNTRNNFIDKNKCTQEQLEKLDNDKAGSGNDIKNSSEFTGTVKKDEIAFDPIEANDTEMKSDQSTKKNYESITEDQNSYSINQMDTLEQATRELQELTSDMLEDIPSNHTTNIADKEQSGFNEPNETHMSDKLECTEKVIKVDTMIESHNESLIDEKGTNIENIKLYENEESNKIHSSDEPNANSLVDTDSNNLESKNDNSLDSEKDTSKDIYKANETHISVETNEIDFDNSTNDTKIDRSEKDVLLNGENLLGLGKDNKSEESLNANSFTEPDKNDSTDIEIDNETINLNTETGKTENDHKRKLNEPMDVEVKKPRLDDNMCSRPRGVKKIYKGATFWPSDFRQKLCTCRECLTMYKDLRLMYLLDPEDTVTAYETLGKQNNDGAPTHYEKGLQALSSLDRIQQINAVTEYNNMRDKLLDFLKSFKDRNEIVKEDDIKAFFAGMKPRREPDGVYFCR